VSTKEIARRLGIAESTIFKHFPKKHDLLMAVLDQYSLYDRDLFLAAKTTMRPQGALVFYLNTYLAYCENYPAITALIHAHEQLRSAPELENRAKIIVLNRWAFMRQLIEISQAEKLDEESDCMLPTPHISVTEETGVIAETILLPGDPLRAKFIAENYLDDPVQFNTTRNMFGYTGTYKGQKISVMGTGMGMPSIGIYSSELINFYGVKNLIRVGSCGAFQDDIKVRDIIIGMSASTNSNYASQYSLPGTYAPTASWSLLKKAVDVAGQKGIEVKVGNILSSDIFYDDDPESWKKWAKMGVLAVEMEAAALYMNASRAGVNALCILTVSDSLVHHQYVSAEERQTTFTQMMEIALELA